jgi:2-hydroxy-3-keto-5-methylthiopentenyl-1-phosphate phosphatase
MLPYVDKNNIYGNDININENNEWKIKLYDEQNNCSINKNHIIKKHYDINKKTIFIGDGLSDFKVIGNVDYLFCKRNSLLHNKCINENYDYIIFDNFTDVLTTIKKLNNN